MTEFLHQIRWRPVIGDPNVMGWVTVAAYALAALTAGVAMWRSEKIADRRMWALVTILMTLLCINKQLDLQSLFTDIGRVMAGREGWYEERRGVQKVFVLGVVGSSALLTAFMAWRFRNFWKRHFLLAAGLAFLLTFIVVRAISFHHVDVFLKREISGVRMNWFLELGGIALIWGAAVSDLLRIRRGVK
jgi:hypothetical protein